MTVDCRLPIADFRLPIAFANASDTQVVHAQ